MTVKTKTTQVIEYRLQSAPMIHMPGMIRWITESGMNREQGWKMFDSMFGSHLDASVCHKVFNSVWKKDYVLDGDTVVVSVEVK